MSNRRKFITGAAASGVALGATLSARTGVSAPHGKSHYKPAHADFRAEAESCLHAGHACLDHCLALLAQGDTSLGDCSKIVKQMIAVCSAVGPIASTGSRHVKSLATLCYDVCTDCKKECDKHAKHHALCKACADACEKMIPIAKALKG